MLKVYNNLIEVLEYNETFIHLFVKNIQSFSFSLDDLAPDHPTFLFDYEIRDQLLLEYRMENAYNLYIFSSKNAVYLIKETTSTQDRTENSFAFNIENYYQSLSIKQMGLTRLAILNKNQIIHEVDAFLTTTPIDFNMEHPAFTEDTSSRSTTISIVRYDIYNLVLTYNHEKAKLNVFKILFNALIDNPNITVYIKSRNQISIETNYHTDPVIVHYRKVRKTHAKKIFDKSLVPNFRNENILGMYTINGARYYIYLQRNGIFLAKSNALRVTQHTASLKVFSTNNYFYIYGRFTHNAYNSFQKYDYLYLRNSNYRITKFIRPFSKVKFLKRFGFFRVPISALKIDDRIHHNLFVGNEERIIHNLEFKENDKKAKTYCFRQYGDNLHVIRTNLHGKITSTTIPFSEEYTFTNRLKIMLARFTSSFSRKKNNVNLYFEKKSNKADESAFRVFEKVMTTETPHSKNYFILNKNSDHYSYMKEKYGPNIIEKYSFKQYLSIYNANFFIASELSNHVLNDRLYIDSLRNKIMEVPLIFLQHGIMFAKPVDNPMAFGFHKDKNQYNMYKSVISSELEAGEFYKMKYEREDLLLTGLATFDYAKLDPAADKIAYMPTYRYWEEGLIYHDEIEDTTYYRSLIKVIKAFEKERLLNRLLIVPHNKFSEHIYRNMPEYRNILSDNPSEALKISRVFITDFSSAIYDAEYRGAYPIFYWEEKDYLIKQYKAIPPVNESNAPGPVVYSVEELMDTVKEAIERNYELEPEFKEKYLKINQFHDGKNTDRIVQFLKEDGII